MGRAEAGTPKAIANKMKSKGLQRLRWFCQVCEKQCRDENGFKCHTQSEGHLRQMLVVGENSGRYIGNYSEQFKHDFLRLLSRRWGTKRVRANQVYQEFITDKLHVHMNSTRWVTLTEFVKYLGREGIVHADETEKGWYIAWIDSSPQALSKQAAVQAKERGEMDDEQRMRKLIDEQIAKAEREKEERGDGPDEEPAPRELTREEGSQPFTLNFGTSLAKKDPSPPAQDDAGPVASTSSAPAAPSAAPAAVIKPAFSLSAKPNPLKANPLKRPAADNPLKSQTPRPVQIGARPGGGGQKMSAMEAIIAEEEERRRRKERQTWSGREGHGAEGLQVKRQKV